MAFPKRISRCLKKRRLFAMSQKTIHLIVKFHSNWRSVWLVIFDIKSQQLRSWCCPVRNSCLNI